MYAPREHQGAARNSKELPGTPKEHLPKDMQEHQGYTQEKTQGTPGPTRTQETPRRDQKQLLGFLWLFLAATGCSWLLLAARGCSCLLPATSWLLPLDAPGCSCLLLLLTAPAYCWPLLAAPGCSWLRPGCLRAASGYF
jgi:hypothetical protein